MRYLAMTLAFLAFPLPAAAQDMCAALNRVAAAAGETPAFASLENRRRGIIPEFDNCWISSSGGERTFVCSRGHYAPDSLIRETFGPVVQDCLRAEPLPPESRFDRSLRYGTPDLVITVSSHCNDRCHVGRSALFTMRRRLASDTPQAPDSR